jgi:hypothetical protein
MCRNYRIINLIKFLSFFTSMVILYNNNNAILAFRPRVHNRNVRRGLQDPTAGKRHIILYTLSVYTRMMVYTHT